MLDRIRQIATELAAEVRFCQRVLSDPRTPWTARIVLGCGVAYALSPVDIIPDFIPVLGHIDDAVIVPLLIRAGLALIPDEVVREHREMRRNGDRTTGGHDP